MKKNNIKIEPNTHFRKKTEKKKTTIIRDTATRRQDATDREGIIMTSVLFNYTLPKRINKNKTKNPLTVVIIFIMYKTELKQIYIYRYIFNKEQNNKVKCKFLWKFE